MSSRATIKGFAMYKLNCCVAVAGASVPLILAGSTSGTLLGLKTVERFVDPAEIAADNNIPGITSLLVVNVYAEFTPGDAAATVLAVGGSAILGIPLEVNVVDGTFFQHPLGNTAHFSPSAALANTPGFNTLKHDSFVTIGRKLDDDPIDGVDQTQIIGLNSWTSTLLTKEWSSTAFGSRRPPTPLNASPSCSRSRWSLLRPSWRCSRATSLCWLPTAFR